MTMMATVQVALLLGAVACFIASALRAPMKLDLLSTGLALWAFAQLIGGPWAVRG